MYHPTKSQPIALAITLATAALALLLGCTPSNQESPITERLSEATHDVSIQLHTERMFEGEETATQLNIKGARITLDEKPPAKGSLIIQLVREVNRSKQPYECLFQTSIQDMAFPPSEEWTEVEPYRIEVTVQPSPLGVPIRQAKHLRINIKILSQVYYGKGNQSASGGNGNHNLLVANPFNGTYSGTYTTGPSNMRFDETGLTLIESENFRYFLMIERLNPHQ
jgi:hypothetical protein